jgi:glutamyl/glutaminyl-tRNA synthetase
MHENESKCNTGFIYTIKCKDDEKLIYVGSTINIKRRWHEHKQAATQSKFKHYLLYNKMSEIGHDRFYIEIYETVIFSFRSELFKRENDIIKLLGTLNTNVLTEFTKQKEQEKNKQSKEKIKEELKEELKKKQKENRQSNQDEITKSIISFINTKYNKTENNNNKIQSSLLLNMYNENNENKIDSKTLKNIMLSNEFICKRFKNGRYYLNLEEKNQLKI